MGTSSVTSPLYVCIYIPEFAVQSLLRLKPELTASPVAILGGEAPFEHVLSTNARASKLGVKKGMTRSELECFTTLCIFWHSKQEEHVARSILLEMAGTFTPRVEVQASISPALMIVLDMTGTTQIFGSPPHMISRLTEAILALKFYGQLAASADFYTATCLAPLARKAPIVLSAGQEAERLRTLPLSILNLTPKQSEIFLLWGLHKVGELADLLEDELVVRFGQEGKRLRLLARGECPHLFVPEEPLLVMEEFVTLDAPVEQTDLLLFILAPMLDQLLGRARIRALALSSITMRFSLDGGGEHVRTIKPALPVAERDVLLKLIHLDLCTYRPSAAILTINVCAEPGVQNKVQADLFSPQLPDPLRLDVTLARIAAFIGEERVGFPRLGNTHRPDSFAMKRFTAPTSTAKVKQKTRVTLTLRRCRPPVVLSVQREEQRLIAFIHNGKRYCVKNSYGPWSRSGDWWSPDVWSHEEWDVHAVANIDDTLICVITLDLLRHHWHLEAVYD